MSHISALVTIVHRNCCLVPPITQTWLVSRIVYFFYIYIYILPLDLWSTGIVWSELLLGYPIFHENSGIDQLVNIISKLGTPTREEIQAMNRDYLKYDLPMVAPVPLATILPRHLQREALDLISQLFQYDPKKRILPLHACAHPYFDELRDPQKKWVNGRKLPELFDFSEFELSCSPSLREILIPYTNVGYDIDGGINNKISSNPIPIMNSINNNNNNNFSNPFVNWCTMYL